jgi:hypothetical protein
MTVSTSDSKAEIAFIKRTYRRLPANSPRPRLYKLFVEKFGRTDVTYSKFKVLCQKLGLKAVSGGRGHLCYGRASDLSSSELHFLESGRDLSPQELHEAFVKKFDRSDLTEQGLYCRAKRMGFRRSTGQRDRPIGFEVIERSGYISIKTNRKSKIRREQWRFKHVLLWEEKNGPVPKGHRLKCIDGNKTNTDPSNWECVPNGVLSRLNKRGFNDAPFALKPTIMAVAKLEHALSEGKRRRRT